jgi:hypothetical protein
VDADVGAVRPGWITRLPFALAAFCFLSADATLLGYPVLGATVGDWFYSGLAAIALGTVTSA